MAHLIRSQAEVKWYPPTADRKVHRFGRCFDHHFADLRGEPAEVDPYAPVTAEQTWWQQAETYDLLPVPELRGAVMRPHPVPRDPAERYISPAAGEWQSESNPSAPWSAIMHEVLGTKMARVVAANPTINTLRAETYLDQAFELKYQLSVPQAADGQQPPQAGLILHLGVINTAGRGQPAHYVSTLRLCLWNPRERDPLTAFWTMERNWDHATETGRVVDRLRSPAAAHEVDDKPELLRVIPVQDAVLIQTSRQEKGWLYHWRGSGWVPAGETWVQIAGCQGWAIWYDLLWPETMEIVGPETQVNRSSDVGDQWYTLEGECRCRLRRRLLWHDDAQGRVDEAEVEATYEVTDEAAQTGQIRVAVTNNSERQTYTEHGTLYAGRRRTPVLLTLQEIHRTDLLDAAEVTPTSLSGRRLTIRYTDQFRGATATLRIRSSAAVLASLRGMGRIGMRARHHYATGAGDWYTVFAGYESGEREFVREADGDWIEFSYQDRSCLWQDGRATMLGLPDLAGWDFMEAAELILTHWGVGADELVWPEGYNSNPRLIPWQLGSAAAKFEAGVGIMEALDTLCRRCGMRWGVRYDGLVWFDWAYQGAPASVWTLQDSALDEGDAVYLAPRYTVDVSQRPNVVQVIGRNEAGDDVEATLVRRQAVFTAAEMATAGYVYGPVAGTPALDDAYQGRMLRAQRIVPDNPAPSVEALRMLEEGESSGRELVWSSHGRNLWPGQVITCNLSGFGCPAGSRFAITGKTTTMAADEGRMPIWRDTFTARMISGEVLR